MKKISVVIPVYNVEKYLGTCFESVINQTYKNLEIIVVNDGSKDSSLEICKKYENLDNRIILIDQKNQGLSVVRNVGIKKATGDYIHFLDSDDYISLNYYEKMIEALGDTDADVVLGGFYHERFPFKTLKYDFVYCYVSMYDKIFTTPFYLDRYACQYLVKKSLLIDNKILFIKGRYFEDRFFTLQVSILANKIITAPSTEYFYRKNDNSICFFQNIKAQEKRDRDYEYMEDLSNKLLKKYNIDLPELNKKNEDYRFKYYFVFIPIITKYIYENKVKYYVCGIRLFTRR